MSQNKTMNNEVKISLTVFTEGSTIVRNGVEVVTYSVTTEDGKNIKRSYSQNKIKHPIVKQVINMSQDAYNNFVSNNCPFGVKPKEWIRMSKKNRLEWHLQQTCDYFNGISYFYEVFEN